MNNKPLLYYCTGVILVLIGTMFFLDPVKYTYRMQYEFRGWLRWFVSFVTIAPGIYLILLVGKNDKFREHICSYCNYRENLALGKDYICPKCGNALK